MSSPAHLTPHLLHGAGEHLTSGQTSHALATAHANYQHQQAQVHAAREAHAATRERGQQALEEHAEHAAAQVKHAKVAAREDPKAAKATAKRAKAEKGARKVQNKHGANLSAQRAAKVKVAEAAKKHGAESDEHEKAKEHLERATHMVRKSSVAGPKAAAKLRTARAAERGERARGQENVEAERERMAQQHTVKKHAVKAAVKAEGQKVKAAQGEHKEASAHLKALQGVHREITRVEAEHARETARATTVRERQHAQATRHAQVHDRHQRARFARISGHVARAMAKAAAPAVAAPDIHHNVHNSARLR